MASNSPEARVRALLDAGDMAGAATAAIRGFGPQVLRYLRSLLGSEADAKEAFSQFAESLWKSLPRFRGEASVRTWCFQLAWSAALHLRREAWRRRGRRLETSEASAIAEEVRTRSSARIESRRRELDKLREALSLEDQSLLELRVDQGLSWAEISQVFSTGGEQVEPNTLMKRFERLKTRLENMAKDLRLVDR